MIDLSFEYGCPPRELAHRLTPGDVVELQQYANKYQLPHRRAELLLAQVAQFIALSNGGKNDTLAAYMPYREPLPSTDALDVDVEDMTPEEIRALHNFEVST